MYFLIDSTHKHHQKFLLDAQSYTLDNFIQRKAKLLL